MNEYTGLISHHGLKYIISTDMYEEIKNNNDFLILLEQYIEGLELLPSVLSFFIALVLILKKVKLLPFFAIILISYTFLNFIAVKLPIYKIPLLCFFAYYVGNIFKFFINYMFILILAIFYYNNWKVFFCYILAIIFSNIISIILKINNTYESILNRNNNIAMYLLNLTNI